MGRLLGRVWVGFTTCLIAFIAYSSQIFIIWPWYGRELSVELLTLLLPFNILVGMLYWNYYLGVVTDPGRVPRNWTPNVQSEEGYEVKPLTGNPRYCRMCDAYKPPRTHHCRQCKRCVLRMDHHCPWVNNCVGHYNYGHFIRFLFFVDVACSYHLTMLIRRTIAAMNARYWEGPDTVEFIFMILNYVTCIPVLLGVGGFSIYHFYCLSKNTTTIEGWEKDKVATLVKRGRIHEVKFPYNVGLRVNIESVLGKNPLLWCCPSIPQGDGLKYPVVDADGRWFTLNERQREEFEEIYEETRRQVFRVWVPGHALPQFSHPVARTRTDVSALRLCVDGAEQAWPPEDPNNVRRFDFDHENDDHELQLPESPWTYENGSVNPALEPTNAFRRRQKSATQRSRRSQNDVANVPPYHPDYGKTTSTSHNRYSSDDESERSDGDEHRYYEGNRRVRRGSEGVEVKMGVADREAILRRYMLTRGPEAGKYRTYVPESASLSPSPPSEPLEVWEDNMPVGAEATESRS